jgi:hypothetical protein
VAVQVIGGVFATVGLVISVNVEAVKRLAGADRAMVWPWRA